MGVLDYNFNDVERPTPLPEGDYLFTCMEVDDTGVSKRTGRGYTKISLEVADDGEFNGRKATYFMSHPMVEDKETTYDDETTKWGLMHRLMSETFAAFGVPVKKGEKFDTTKMIGQSCVGNIEHELDEETENIRWSIGKLKAA